MKVRKILFFVFFLFIQIEIFSQGVVVDTLVLNRDTTDLHFIRYTPENARFRFVREKPDIDDESIYMSVVAAFTSRPPERIVGKTVSNGIGKIYPTEEETAYCIIINDTVDIFPLHENSNYNYKEAIKRKGDYFQQMLLVWDFQIKKCDVFKDRKTERRALVLINGQASIVESEEKLHIDDFSRGLVELGADKAIYLDMGSWSQGWYRKKDNTIVDIGKNWKSSHLQTNWLIITD